MSDRDDEPLFIYTHTASRRHWRDMAFFFLGCCFAGVAMRWLMAITGGI